MRVHDSTRDPLSLDGLFPGFLEYSTKSPPLFCPDEILKVPESVRTEVPEEDDNFIF